MPPPRDTWRPLGQVITIPFRLAFLDGPLTPYCDYGCVYASFIFDCTDLAVDAMLLTDVLLRLLSLAEPAQRPPDRDRCSQFVFSSVLRGGLAVCRRGCRHSRTLTTGRRSVILRFTSSPRCHCKYWPTRRTPLPSVHCPVALCLAMALLWYHYDYLDCRNPSATPSTLAASPPRLPSTPVATRPKHEVTRRYDAPLVCCCALAGISPTRPLRARPATASAPGVSVSVE